MACGEDRDAEFVGKGFNDGQSLASDGAGAAEDGESFHCKEKCKSERVKKLKSKTSAAFDLVIP